MADSLTSSSRSILKKHLMAAREQLVQPEYCDASENPVRMGVIAALRGLGEHAEAVPLYNAVLATNAAHVAALRGRVDASIASGANEAALSHISAAIEVLPDDPTIRLKEATVLQAIGRSKEATKILISLASNSSVTPAQKVSVARGLMASKEYAAAGKLFGQALSEKPDIEGAWLGQADLALAMGEPSLAVSRCERGLERFPGNSAIRSKMAVALSRLGKTFEALSMLEDLTQSSPENPKLLLTLAGELRRAGRFGEAETIYSTILAKNPSNRGALHAQIDIALALGDVGTALERCDQALSQLGKEDDQTLQKNGQVLLRAGRPADALSIFVALRNEAPPNSPVHISTARSFLALGKADEAEKIFEELRQIDPGNRPAILGLVEIAERRGDLEQATNLLDQHIRMAN